MKRQIKTSSEEPEQKKFEIPSEGEHQFQVVDKWISDTDDNIILVKLEVSDGEEAGRSILHRVNLDSEWKGFFLTRLFLKAIGEPYKDEFTTDDDNWIGRMFYATIIHNEGRNGKIYANIDSFNFDKVVDVDKKIKIDNNEIAWDE